MNNRARYFVHMLAAVVVTTALAGTPARADSMKEQLVGAWIMTRADSVRPDGSRTENFGPNPKGIMIFSSDGHFALVQMKNDIPRIQANARDKGTPEASTFANVMALGDQSRVVTLLTPDELQFRNARTPTGAVLEIAFKRAR